MLIEQKDNLKLPTFQVIQLHSCVAIQLCLVFEKLDFQRKGIYLYAFHGVKHIHAEIIPTKQDFYDSGPIAFMELHRSKGKAVC